MACKVLVDFSGFFSRNIFRPDSSSDRNIIFASFLFAASSAISPRNDFTLGFASSTVLVNLFIDMEYLVSATANRSTIPLTVTLKLLARAEATPLITKSKWTCTKPQKNAQKILVKDDTRTHVLPLGRSQKSKLTSTHNSHQCGSWRKPAYRAYQICHFVGLKKRKKRKITTIVCVFLRKAPTKNESWKTS